MSNFDKTKLSMNPRGAFVGSNAYKSFDIVTYNGHVYLAMCDSRGNFPTGNDSDNPYWMHIINTKAFFDGVRFKINKNKHLVLSYEDGSVEDIGRVVGDAGDKGEKGDTGDVGNGITSVDLNDNYTLTINFTDNTSFTTTPIRGEKGTSFTYKQEWSPDKEYKQNDVVTWLGSSYIAKVDVPPKFNNPEYQTGHWAILAARGGDGANGKDGRNGQNGRNGRSFNWRGDYDAKTQYYEYDCVRFDGKSYCLFGAVMPGISPYDNKQWGIIAESGADGRSFKWRGEWVNGKEYFVDDVVSYNGSSYICVKKNRDWSPLSKAFELMSSCGSKGETGDVGQKGESGQGFTWRGEFDADESYRYYDVARDATNGNLYICISKQPYNSDVIPSKSDEWELFLGR